MRMVRPCAVSFLLPADALIRASTPELAQSSWSWLWSLRVVLVAFVQTGVVCAWGVYPFNPHACRGGGLGAVVLDAVRLLVPELEGRCCSAPPFKRLGLVRLNGSGASVRVIHGFRA